MYDQRHISVTSGERPAARDLNTDRSVYQLALLIEIYRSLKLLVASHGSKNCDTRFLSEVLLSQNSAVNLLWKRVTRRYVGNDFCCPSTRTGRRGSIK
jgi:hypothetical protein